MKKIFTLTLMTLFAYCMLSAQTNDDGLINAPGDIAFVAFNNGPDGYSFVFIDDCPAGVSIKFIDEEWNGTAFTSASSEGENTWTNNTGSPIAAGTVITVQNADNNPFVNIGNVTESDAGFNIANGDNIFALLGTRASPTTFLAFVGDIDGASSGTPNTLAGTGLTDGIHAVDILSNAIYTGSTTCNGTLTDCLQMINDNNNWNAGAFPSDVPTSFDGSNFVTCDDSTSPTITCPGPQNRDLDGSCSYTIEDFTSLGTAMDLDNCGAPTVTQSPAANGSITVPGTTQVTLTATDGDNNTGNCNFNLIVADNSAPTVTCPVIDFSAQVTVQVVRNDFGDPAGVSWQILDAGNNVVANQTTTLPVGPTAINYNLPCDAGYTLVLNSSIGAGLLDAQVQVAFIPIIDLDPPIASGSYPFTIAPCNAANPGTCSVVLSGLAPTVNDNCAATTTYTLMGATTGSGNTDASGSTFNVGTTTLMYTATDAAGNAGSCSVDITIDDNTNPTANCPTNITQNQTAGQCGANVNFTIPAATDNCSVMSTSANPASGSFFAAGTTQVTVTAMDASGNTGTCTFDVTINDTENPTANCPGTQTVANTAGQCGANVSFSIPTPTDNCTATSSASPASGSFFNVGTTQVTVTATDGTNTDQCTFNVVVNDTEGPTFTCPQNMNVSVTGNANCEVTIPNFADVVMDEMDNCGLGSNTLQQSIPPGSFNSNGNGTTITVDLSLTDAATGTTTGPTVVWDESIDGDLPSNGFSNNSQFQAISLFEGVNIIRGSVANITNVNGSPNGDAFSFVVPSGASVTTLDIDLTFFATGNTSSTFASFSGSPLTFIESTFLSASGSLLGIFGGSPIAPGNYGLLIGENEVEGTTYEYTITCTGCPPPPPSMSGNTTANCSVVLTVVDDVAPSITCPQNISVNAPANQCFAAVTFAAPTASDNCPGVSVLANPMSGSNFNVGTTTVTAIATDAAGNSSTPCTFNITVNDVTPPSATCPNDVTVSATPGQCGASISYAGPLVSDACGIAPEGGVVCSPASGSFFSVGTTPVSCTVMDVNGNSSNCSFNITVNDNEDPVPICPATQTRNNDPGQCGAIVTFAVDGTDNCGPNPLTLSHPSGSFFPVGTTSVMLTATDLAGNSSSCNFDVVVNDTESPDMICKRSIIDVELGQTLYPTQIDSMSTDNCAIAQLSVEYEVFNCDNVGASQVTLTARDEAGNSNTCTATVNVIDNNPPTAACANRTVNLTSDGTTTVAASFFDAGSSAVCGGVDFSASQTDFDCDDVGNTIAVTLTVTAQTNNQTATCTSMVTVTDEDSYCCAPANAVCNNTSVQLNASGSASIMPSDVGGGSTAECGLEVESVTPMNFSCSDVNNPVTVTYTIEDENGATSSCTAIVTVEDNIAPSAACLSNSVFLQADGTYNLQDVDVLDFINSNDNCGFYQVTSISPATLDCDDLGMTLPIMVTIADGSGNTDNCTANVTVNVGEALPGGWSANNVGNSGTAGNDFGFDPCVGVDGEFSITGGGQNATSSTTDNVAFAGQFLCGNDVSITAKIESIDPNGYGGLMIRETTAAGAKQVAIFSNQTNVLRHETRYTTNGPKQVNAFYKPAPIWLRLQRQGNWVFAYYSNTGWPGTFQYVHGVFVPMNSCVYVGLASFTYQPGQQTTAVFSNVSISGSSAPAAEVPGITEASQAKFQQGINLYPNPTRDIVNLTFEDGLSKDAIVTLRNQLGQVVEQRELRAGDFTTEWNVSMLADGLYLFEIRQDGEAVQVLRLVKTQ